MLGVFTIIVPYLAVFTNCTPDSAPALISALTPALIPALTPTLTPTLTPALTPALSAFQIPLLLFRLPSSISKACQHLTYMLIPFLFVIIASLSRKIYMFHTGSLALLQVSFQTKVADLRFVLNLEE
ncbi:hypothetical protein GG344DRAFT_84518 [Lentinula edodes]|nr:hypothetical protein GG344DRAFT_84518 [Lentinula edodes]